MGHARFQDFVAMVVIFLIAGGVYGIFFLLGLESIGPVFAGITIFVLICIDCCFLPSYLQKRKSRKYEKK